MEYTIIDVFDKSYILCDQIQKRVHERASYEVLCAEVFPGLSFEKWYQAGYWDGKLFNPTVLMDGDRIVSAVSGRAGDAAPLRPLREVRGGLPRQVYRCGRRHRESGA